MQARRFAAGGGGNYQRDARGEHPQRTPFYGVCLLSGAFLACWLASSINTVWLSIVIYVLAGLAAVFGFVMTFRDYSF
jgi:hypothetical protein